MGFIRKAYNIFIKRLKQKLTNQFIEVNLKTLRFEDIAIKSLFKAFESSIELYSMFFWKVAIKEINYSANYLLFVFQYKPTTFVSVVWKRIGTLQSGKTTKVVALCC